MNDFKKLADIAGERLFDCAPGALEEVIDLYQKRIYNLAYRFTGDKEEAFDLSQEIFIRVYSKIKLFSPNTDFNAWFMRLSVNTAINYRSKTRRNPSHVAEEFCDANGSDDSCPGNKAADHIGRESLNREIAALLGQLPKRERMALTLQLWEKKKVKEIAQLTGVSVKSVESLLTRARKRLKKIMKKNEGL
ncbi:MAG: sigma-70 family RNA polymerase sigma factor [bacterium]|nr:sigma-70 family RNA polymerase sigma factor [bacterium]